MDGLTTNGVLIMHPKGKFCGGNALCGLWRETSLGGDVFSLRESRSAQQKGQPVSLRLNLSHAFTCHTHGTTLCHLSQIKEESNVLQDGTLIDLCGATLLWRSAEGLQNSPVRKMNLRN
jgi:pellino